MPPPTFWYAARIANVCISNVLARGAQQHFTWAGRQSAVKVGHGVLAISVTAGTGADVMAGGAGAVGPAPDVRHPPPGYPDLVPYNTGYPGLSRLIPKQGYPGISRDNPTGCLSRDNP